MATGDVDQELGQAALDVVERLDIDEEPAQSLGGGGPDLVHAWAQQGAQGLELLQVGVVDAVLLGALVAAEVVGTGHCQVDAGAHRVLHAECGARGPRLGLAVGSA